MVRVSMADHLRRVLPLVALPRLRASLGEGGPGGRGGLGGTTERRLMSETRPAPRPQARFHALARRIQPVAMSFDTV
jgi:hypothetical protein